MLHSQRIFAAMFAAALVTAPLAGCAPEPGTVPSDGSKGEAGLNGQPGGKGEGEKPQPDGESWPEKAPDEAFEKHQEVPNDFPESFSIPEGAVIDDVGSGANGTWFLVLRADSLEEGEALWNAVIEGGGFAVTEGPEPAEGGRTAELESSTLAVSATMFPPEGEDFVLLSYDISPLLP